MKLIEICCQELCITPNDIIKVRKLPNTILRKDKDVMRLKDFQEIEIIMIKSLKQTPIQKSIFVNRNQYESISTKKDQTVLY